MRTILLCSDLLSPYHHFILDLRGVFTHSCFIGTVAIVRNNGTSESEGNLARYSLYHW